MQKRGIHCHQCDHTFTIHCVEFPPKIIVCTGCDEIMLLSGHDEDTQVSFYHIHKL